MGQTMTGLFAQSEIEWTPKFRTTVGVRADIYQFDVTSDLAANSGSGSDTMASPKFGAVLSPWSGTELYLNAGMGYHSNDARGAVTTIDPVSGDATDPVTPLVRAKGAEFGLRTVKVRGLQSTVSLWYSASTRSCCSSVMPARRNPAGPAAAWAWSGPTTGGSSRG